MRHVVLVSVLNACFAGPVLAQPQKTSDTVQNSQQFAFTTAASGGLTKSDRFCLPRDQRLLKVIGVETFSSNGQSTINAWPDLTANCVELSVVLPPAKSVCTKIPQIHGFTLKFNEKCDYIPTIVGFSVKYETEKVSPTIIPDQSSGTPPSDPPVEEKPKQ